MIRAISIFLVVVAAVLVAGTIRNRDFWSTPDQRGDALFRAKKYSEAAKTYSNPWNIAVAQYRNGDFEKAAKTFARVPGATGAFDQGNAWLMHGNYDAAIASYDRALGFRADWKDAEENKALAIARKQMMDDKSGMQPGEVNESGGTDIDQKSGNDDDQEDEPEEMSTQEMSDEQLRATWLRRVQTTPGDFLKAKFAWQAAHPDRKEAEKQKEGGTQ